MSTKTVGRIMLAIFTIGLVSALFTAYGRAAVLVIAGATGLVVWVIVAINLITGHPPFSLSNDE